ncbi:MAG: aspartate--tRNA ligase, partial [Clostridia bacterium]|nr:aspartate--tRNA ligase [Clostridia bacterium]
MGKFNRTHMCGELNEGNIGQQITVYGWVQKSRDLGSLKFIDLRDRTGIVQAVINKDATEDLFNEAAKVRGEFVLEISGEVAKRGGAVNTKISTGSIEIIVSNMQIISKAETPPIY